MQTQSRNFGLDAALLQELHELYDSSESGEEDVIESSSSIPRASRTIRRQEQAKAREVSSALVRKTQGRNVRSTKSMKSSKDRSRCDSSEDARLKDSSPSSSRHLRRLKSHSRKMRAQHVGSKQGDPSLNAEPSSSQPELTEPGKSTRRSPQQSRRWASKPDNSDRDCTASNSRDGSTGESTSATRETKQTRSFRKRPTKESSIRRKPVRRARSSGNPFSSLEENFVKQ